MLTIQNAPVSLGIHALPLALAAMLIVSALLCLRLYASRFGSTAKLPVRHGVTHGATEDSFVHALARAGLNPRIARTTYRHLQRRGNIAFPILPEDRLRQELGFEIRALSETILGLLRENDRQVLPGLEAGSVVTVADLVAIIQRSPFNERERAA